MGKIRSLSFTIYSLLMIAVATSAFQFARAETASKEQLLATFTFRIAENIFWKNTSSFTQYHIHVVDKNPDIEKELENISKQRQLHGKRVEITRSSSSIIPANTQIVYVADNSLEHYSAIFSSTSTNNILLITHNLQDNSKSLIDLIDNNKLNRINFKINKANILIREFGINPDVILLGGTEIDVAQLFTEGQKKLQQQTVQLTKIEQDLLLLREEDQRLTQRLKNADNEATQYKNSIITLNDEIKIAQENVAQLQRKTESETRLLQEREKQLEKLRDVLIVNENELSNTEAQLAKQKKELYQLNADVIKGKEILELQKNLLRNQTELISTQETNLQSHTETIQQQQSFLLLASAIGTLLALLSALVFVGYTRIRKLNKRLSAQSIALKTANSAAERSARAKSVFLSSMSHELRSPLTSILGFSQLMREEQDIPENVKSYVEIINRSGEHLLNLISDVLDLSKIEAGRIHLNNDAFDFQAMLRNVVEMSHIHADSKGLKLVLEIEPDCIQSVVGDESKIKQIFINLITNAIKFTEEGGISVRVKSKLTEKQGIVKITGTVSDTGVGIPADQVDTIFQPFEQVVPDTIRSDSSQGTGLGLSLTRELLTHMNGDISVSSDVGQGSTFTFNLHLTTTTESLDRQVEEVRTPRISGVAPNQKNIHSLIVEDLQDSALYLTRILERAGNQVSFAANGAKAVELCQQEMPDIIWMDRRMPVMDGIEAAQHIRKLPKGDTVCIVAMTASVFKEDEQEIMQHGFDGYIRKPYVIDIVYKTLSDLLNVEIQYKDAVDLDDNNTSTDLTLEDFAALPTQTKILLAQYIRALDIEAINQIITEIADAHPTIAGKLTVIVDAYDFSAIQKLLD